MWQRAWFKSHTSYQLFWSYYTLKSNVSVPAFIPNAWNILMSFLSWDDAQTRRVGDILFLVRIPSASAASAFLFPCIIFWTSKWIFNQTCTIDTLLREVEVLIRFWWPWPYFQGHRGPLKCLKYGFCALSSELVDWFWPKLHRYIVGRRGRVRWSIFCDISRSQRHFEMSKVWFPCLIFWTRGWILTKLAQMHCWEKGKSWLNFGELDHISRSQRHFRMSKIWFPCVIFWTSW